VLELDYSTGKIMKTILILASMAFAINLANAQTPPETIFGLSKKTDNIVKKGDLTSQQRAYLWDKTSHDRSGFLVVEVDVNYLDTIRYLLNDPTVKAEALPSLGKFNLSMGNLGFVFVGNLIEDNYRYDTFYRDESSDLLMITRWEYKKAGAAISTAEEFFNQKIDGIDAVLSVATANNDKRCIWKLTWAADGVLYEIYRPDKLDVYGKPKKIPDDIMRVAREVALLHKASGAGG
jgi:hypothetical protein